MTFFCTMSLLKNINYKTLSILRNKTVIFPLLLCSVLSVCQGNLENDPHWKPLKGLEICMFCSWLQWLSSQRERISNRQSHHWKRCEETLRSGCLWCCWCLCGRYRQTEIRVRVRQTIKLKSRALQHRDGAIQLHRIEKENVGSVLESYFSKDIIERAG